MSKVLKNIYVPTLTFGHKLWIVTEITQIQTAEMSFLCWVAGLSLRDRVRSSNIWRELGATAPLCRKESAEVLRPPLRGFLGMSDWEETPGQTQNPLEGGLYIPSGLGMPRDPPGGAGVLLGKRMSGGGLLSLLPPRPGPK